MRILNIEYSMKYTGTQKQKNKQTLRPGGPDGPGSPVAPGGP